MKPPLHFSDPDAKTLRQFAFGWGVFFIALAGYELAWRQRATLALWLGVVAMVGVAAHGLAPRIFRAGFRGWMWLAFPVGWTVSQLALGLMFYGVLTPTAWVLRVTRRDRLRLRRPGASESGWTRRRLTRDVRRYFRPY